MCKKWGWLLCLDEVQTCMGRCGEMFAFELWQGIDPDLVLMGKAFSGGGQPIAGLLGTDEVMKNTELHLGSTYGFVPPLRPRRSRGSASSRKRACSRTYASSSGCSSRR